MTAVQTAAAVIGGVAGLIVLTWAWLRVELWWRERRTFGRDRSGITDTELEELLAETFEDYRQSIADLLDANPERSAELIQGLDEATEKWSLAQFEAITRPMQRDRTLRRLDRQLNKT